VGRVGHEPALPFRRPLEPVEHGVHRLGQPADLVVDRRLADPVVERGGVGDGRHLGADELDGPQRPSDEKPHQEAGQEQDTRPAIGQGPAELGHRLLGLFHLGAHDHVGRPVRRLAGENHHPEVGLRGDRRAVDRALDEDPVGGALLRIDVDEGVRLQVVLAGGDHAAGLVDDLDEHRPVVLTPGDRDHAAKATGPGPGGDVLGPGEVGLVDVADQRPRDDHHQIDGAHPERRRHHEHRQRGGAGPDGRQEPPPQRPQPATGPDAGPEARPAA
jgi:hypothetical protein